MIVITTPTGRVGSQLVRRLLDGVEPCRVIARDPSRLDGEVTDGAELITGSHDDPSVLDRALAGADSLFWLVPPSWQIVSPEAHYLSFARAAAEAVRRNGVARVVAVSSAGHGWPKPAGLLSAAFAMDAEIKRTDVAYRALSMPFYMENLLDQAGSMREQGVFFFPYDPDRPLASVATQDIAATAAVLLADHSWDGQENLPVFGPEPLSPNAMAAVISDVLGRQVSYRRVNLEDVAQQLTQAGANEAVVRGMTQMMQAQNEGIYDEDQATAVPGPTDFRTWCERAPHQR